METIGDAYCVASGLHRKIETHAPQIAWMALRMVETCAQHLTHEGNPIKVFIYFTLSKLNTNENLL